MTVIVKEHSDDCMCPMCDIELDRYTPMQPESTRTMIMMSPERAALLEQIAEAATELTTTSDTANSYLLYTQHFIAPLIEQLREMKASQD